MTQKQEVEIIQLKGAINLSVKDKECKEELYRLIDSITGEYEKNMSVDGRATEKLLLAYADIRLLNNRISELETKIFLEEKTRKTQNRKIRELENIIYG